MVSSILIIATETNKELVRDSAGGPFLVTSTPAFGCGFFVGGQV